MHKRVSMAQALMGSPPVIFLDEPTAGLDLKIAASVRNVIRDLKGKHTGRASLSPGPASGVFRHPGFGFSLCCS